MKVIHRTLARSMALASVALIATSSFAKGSEASGTPAQDVLKELSVSGFLDFYYQYDFNRSSIKAPLAFRQFDVRNNSLTLANVQLNFVKPTSETNPWGYTLNLASGRNQDIQNAGEPVDTSTFRLLQQAYVTYAGKGGLTIDLGKWFTWDGYEGAVAANNDIYSISNVFYFLEPTYHFGLRASKPINSKLTGSLYLVNGWNEVEDSNGGKSYGASLSANLGKTSLVANYYGGIEGSSGTNGIGLAGSGNVQLIDFVATHQLTDKIKLAFTTDYASVSSIDAGDPSGKFYGAAGYVKATLSPSVSATVRYDSISDPDNLRATNGGRVSSFTSSLELATSKTSFLRLEVRNDWSNRKSFASSEGPRSGRTTALIAHVFKF